MKWIYGLIFSFLFSGCLGLESDDIDKELDYKPTLSLAIGDFWFQYNSLEELSYLPQDTLIAFSFVDTDSATISLSNSINSSDDIKHLVLHLDLVNRFPAAAQLELFYTDILGVNIAIFDKPMTIEPAVVDEAGTIISATEIIQDYELGLAQINSIYYSDKLIFKITVKNMVITSSTISHMSDYDLEVLAGLHIQVKLL